MKNSKAEMQEYCYDTLDDYLLFSNHIDDDLELVKSAFLDEEYLEYLDSHIKGIIEESIYPHEIKPNLDKVLKYIESSIKESNALNKDDLLDIYYRIYGRYISKDFENSYEIYYLEFSKKFNDLGFYTESSHQALEKKFFNESIRNDYLVLASYSFDNETYLNTAINNFINNPYYILSIKKFLYDMPIMFSDESIKQRTINILNLNIALFEENINENTKEEFEKIIHENKILIDTINNLNKNNFENVFCITNFKEYYHILMIKKILCDNSNIENSEYKEYIKTELFMNNIDRFIDLYLIDEKAKNKIVQLLEYSRDLIGTNEAKIKCNEIKFKLSKKETENEINILLDEAYYKYSFYRRLREHFDSRMYGLDSLKYEMIDSIKYDFKILQLYLSDEKNFNEKLDNLIFSDERILYSIRLFLNDYPSLFSEETIYDRTMKLLNKNMELCSNRVDLNILKEENKLTISETKKIISKIKKIKR